MSEQTDIPIVKDYLHDGAFRLEYAVRKVGELPTANRKHSEDYKHYLELRNRKPRTVARRLHELLYIFKLLGKDAKKATKIDIENVVLEINKSDMAIISKAMIKRTIKKFYRFLYLPDSDDPHEYPAIVKWIKVDKPKNSKLPDDLLTEEEMIRLIKSCKSHRDKAIMSILATFGCRVGELLNLKVKDVVLGDKEVSWILFDGKTGERRVPFTSNSLCYPYIVNHLNEYSPKDPNAPLFITKEGTSFDYKNVRRLLFHLKEWTGIKKRLHPHLFRYSVATALAGTLTEQHLKRYMGWSQDSNMASVYVKMNDKDLATGLMRATGMNNEPEKHKPSVKTCIKCKKISAITNNFCENCGSLLDMDKIYTDTLDVVNQQQEMKTLKKELSGLREAVNLLLKNMNLIEGGSISKVLEKEE